LSLIGAKDVRAAVGLRVIAGEGESAGGNQGEGGRFGLLRLPTRMPVFAALLGVWCLCVALLTSMEQGGSQGGRSKLGGEGGAFVGETGGLAYAERVIRGVDSDPAVIRGTVRDADTGDPVPGAKLAFVVLPLAGGEEWYIGKDSAQRFGFKTMADAEGRYQIEIPVHKEAEHWVAEVVAPGYARFCFERLGWYRFWVGKQIASKFGRIEAPVRPSAPQVGEVTEWDLVMERAMPIGETVVDIDGEPVSGARVGIQTVQESGLMPVCGCMKRFTDERGEFRIEDTCQKHLIDERYLSVRKSGFLVNEELNLGGMLGSERENFSIVLRPEARFEGVVKGESGQPLSGVSVTLYPPREGVGFRGGQKFRMHQYTDSNGVFRFDVEREARHPLRLVCQKTGGVFDELVDVSGEEILEIILDHTPPAEDRFRLDDKVEFALCRSEAGGGGSSRDQRWEKGILG